MEAKNGLSLRAFTVADLDDFYEWASDEKVTEFMTWETFRSKEKARDFLVKVVIPPPMVQSNQPQWEGHWACDAETRSWHSQLPS